MPRARGKKAKINRVIDEEQENKEIYVAPYLQQEIIFEILSYLPVDSLLRCKCVCKLWGSITGESEFIRNHMNRAKFVELYEDNDDVSGDEEKFKKESSVDGLVVEKCRSTNKYRIRNPATRQVLCLPDPDEHLKYTRTCICYAPTAKVYKLFHISWGKESMLVDFQILTVANDLKWRSLNIPSLQNLLSNNARAIPRCYGGTFYIVIIVNGEFGDNEIIWIDSETEAFSSVKIPQGLFSDWKNVQTMMYNQKLSFVTILEEKLHVWVLEDYKENKWAERKILLPKTFMKDFPNMREKPLRMAIIGSHLCIDGNHQRIIYDTDCKKVVHTKSRDPGKKFLGYFRSTAIHLRGMQPLQRNERNG